VAGREEAPPRNTFAALSTLRGDTENMVADSAAALRGGSAGVWGARKFALALRCACSPGCALVAACRSRAAASNRPFIRAPAMASWAASMCRRRIEGENTR
jgi:hypothetical protein